VVFLIMTGPRRGSHRSSKAIRNRLRRRLGLEQSPATSVNYFVLDVEDAYGWAGAHLITWYGEDF
jgi:hypothetical protein